MVLLGTWNTRQLGATTGHLDQDLKLTILLDIWNLRKWELVALTDTKLGTPQTLETQKTDQPKWIVISRGRVALALNDRWAQAWRYGNLPIHTDGQGAQCRMMLVQIPCFQRLGLAVLVTYAHSSRATPAELQTYFQNLDTLLTHVKPRYTVVVAGDFNAEVGVRTAHTGQALGPHGPANRNYRGSLLLDFCNEHNLAVANTWTPQQNKATWWHPRFGTPHLLDYFLVPHAQIGNVHRVLTIHPQIAWEHHLSDWTSDTDHNPVELTIKLAPPKGIHRTRNIPVRAATAKGRGNSQQAIALREQYRTELEQRMLAQAPCRTWDEITTLVTTTAQEIFGVTEPRGSAKPWFVGRQDEIRALNLKEVSSQWVFSWQWVFCFGCLQQALFPVCIIMILHDESLPIGSYDASLPIGSSWILPPSYGLS